ncbi:MAG: maturation protein [Sanya fiers-like virus 23]|nr:MAG: maturation protein [Sanya fiers-like virus 23]
MVAPVSGLKTRYVVEKGPTSALGYKPDWLNWRIYWYTQRRPYNLSLNYQIDRRQIIRAVYGSGGVQYASVSQNCYTWNSSIDAGAYNKAYQRFRDDVYTSASLAVSLAERKQSMDMIYKRSVQLLTFTRQLRRLDFRKAAKTLGLSKPPAGLSRRKTAKAFANNFLEYHFGWSPLVKDIYDCVSVLESRIPPHRATGRATVEQSVPEFLSGNRYDKNHYLARCQLRADVRVDNPNLALATQLGVTNPAIVAWELVPFSFVVDWFMNVGDFLQSFTDFAGFQIMNPCKTTKNVVTSSQRYNQVYPYVGMTVLAQSVFFLRMNGTFAGPTLRVRDPWVLSPTRAATAVALLIQQGFR